MSALLPSQEQREFVEEFLRPLATLLPVSRLQKDVSSDVASWNSLAELGWLAAAASEDVGGVGLSAVECALMSQRLGEFLASPTVVATIVAARLLEASQPESSKTLASGEVRAAFGFVGSDGLPMAVDPMDAALLVVIGKNAVSIHAVQRYGAPLSEAHTLWSSSLRSCVMAKTLLTTSDPIETANVLVMLAAQSAGIAVASRDTAVEYAKLRQQFGQPIGAFQAVKHQCADMAARALAAVDLVCFASVAVAESRDDAPFLSAAALNLAVRSAVLNAGSNIHIHGGMGFSQECSAHHYLKRARVLEALAGGVSGVRQRVMAMDPRLAG